MSNVWSVNQSVSHTLNAFGKLLCYKTISMERNITRCDRKIITFRLVLLPTAERIFFNSIISCVFNSYVNVPNHNEGLTSESKSPNTLAYLAKKNSEWESHDANVAYAYLYVCICLFIEDFINKVFPPPHLLLQNFCFDFACTFCHFWHIINPMSPLPFF